MIQCFYNFVVDSDRETLTFFSDELDFVVLQLFFFKRMISHL